MDFENLKNSQSNFDKLTKQIESNLNPEDNAKTKNKYQDDRLWKPELDKTGNGYAVLRFLPEYGLTLFKDLADGTLKTL